MDAAKEFKRYEGVGVSSEAIWQGHKGRVIERLSKEAVISCDLQYGSPEQKPIVSACLGGVLLSPGILLMQHVVAWFRGEVNLIQFRYEAAMLLMVGIGFWLIIQALVSRRYFVYVTSREKTVRLLFNREAKLAEIKLFLAEARERYGWQIDDRFHS